MSTPTCSVCGRPTSSHDRDVRFNLPNPVRDLPDRERTDGVWMSHATALESVMLQVPNVGAFVRSLLTVHLTQGDSVTFGVWLAIDPREHALRQLFDMWWDDTRYRNLALSGWLANDLAPWTDLLAAPVVTEVCDVNETPYCVSSSHGTLSKVLTEIWDREWVLSAIPQ